RVLAFEHWTRITDSKRERDVRKFALVTALVALLACVPAARAATYSACTNGTKTFTRGHNPVPGWHPSRVDQGVDGTLSASGYRAAFGIRIVIADAHKSGWANGGYIVGRILHGDLAGEYIFV